MTEDFCAEKLRASTAVLPETYTCYQTAQKCQLSRYESFFGFYEASTEILSDSLDDQNTTDTLP